MDRERGGLAVSALKPRNPIDRLRRPPYYPGHALVGCAAWHGERVVRMASKNKKQSGEVLIPDKLYFRIGEVARLCRLPAYVLRFWETEFPQLKPGKSNTGQRMYRRRDVETVVYIKKLLYEDGFTIAGARQFLRAETRPGKTQDPLPFGRRPSRDGLRQVRQGLKEILSMLSSRR